MKHGLYMAALQADDIEDLEKMTSISAAHELVLLRVGLRRAARYLGEDDVPLADVLAILPVLSTVVRTVDSLLSRMNDIGFDWDEVLDELGKDWEINI